MKNTEELRPGGWHLSWDGFGGKKKHWKNLGGPKEKILEGELTWRANCGGGQTENFTGTLCNKLERSTE
jgi:hypothetical protein